MHHEKDVTRSKLKSMIHTEMAERGLVVEKKKKSRASRDREKYSGQERKEKPSRSKSRSKTNDDRHHSGGHRDSTATLGRRSAASGTTSRGRSGGTTRSRDRTREKSASVVTFSSKNESKTFTEIDEKTARSIDSCSSGVQSGSNNSDLDSLNSPKDTRKPHLPRTEKSCVKTSSDSDVDTEKKFKESLRMRTLERKQRGMEAKVEEQERKLAEFAQKLSLRKAKLEDLHSRLKQRKITLKEREDKLRIFEAQIVEREEKLRSKSKVVRHKEAKLRHEEGSVKLREESVTDKLSQLEKRTKLIEMKEDLSAEITDLTRKQLYQSSWNLAGTLKHKKEGQHRQSTDSLDLLSDDDTDDLIHEVTKLKIARSNKVGLVL